MELRKGMRASILRVCLEDHFYDHLDKALDVTGHIIDPITLIYRDYTDGSFAIGGHIPTTGLGIDYHFHKIEIQLLPPKSVTARR